MSRSRLSPPLRRWWACARLLALAMFAGQCFAQGSPDVVPPFSPRHWQRAEGLGSNEITGLCLDRTGYLWIITWTGLSRFDGSRFQNYDYVPPGQLATTGFAAIAPDPVEEGVWVAPHTGGLLKFRQGRFEPEMLPGDYPRQRIARLFVAADGALWIAFEGGDVMRWHGGRSELFGTKEGLGPTRSTHFASDGAGRVWLANGPQLAWYESGTLYPLPLDGLSENLRIASARQDGPWVLTRGWLHKVVDGRLGPRMAVNSSFNARSVQTMLEDASGAIWTGTRAHGVRRLTWPDQKSELVLEQPEDVGVLLEDRSGNIWAGSNGGGLVRLRSGVARRFDKAQGLLESHTLGVCEDNAGTIWIANRDGGVAYITETGRVRTLAPPPMRETFSARSLAPAGSAGVLVTTSRGLLRATRDGLLDLDAPGAPPQPPPHGEMRVTHLASNGDLWMDIDPGRLGRLREGNWQVFTAADGLGAGSPQVITEDAQGRIWVGMEENQLYRFDGSRFTPVPLPASTAVGSVQALHFDASGTGWVGTSGAGLMRLGGSARSLDKRHGLPSNEISQVISDDQGSLWCGSPEGIFRVRRQELEKFFAGEIASVDAVVLSADDGLGETNCAGDHQPSAWKSRSGVLWFATRQGVVAINPRNEKLSGTPVVVQIDAVRAGEQSWPAAARPVRVPALSRVVEMDYSVLSLTNPDRVRARVRLQGYDDEWTTADARGVARYPRLPPGEYQFVVEARLVGAPGTSARVSLPVVVVAAWWQTLWFRAALVVLCLLLAAVAARAWSHRRLRARLAELEQATALERERARIAQNIHDDLGAGLTRISLLTQASEAGDGRGQLDKIYRTVSGLTQSMDAIVWAVNPKNDNLESFANYLVEFAQGFLTDAEIRCRVILPEVLPPLTLPAQFRHDLFLSCKEALNNAVKHARASEVTVQLGEEGGKLVVRISDNGRGLTAAEATGGRRGAKNGLRNMQSRLAGLGGACEITSSDIGTVVTLTAPLSAETNSP